MQDMNWLRENYRNAYDNLTSSYRQENCLVFFVEGERLFAKPREVLFGKWVAIYDELITKWVYDYDMTDKVFGSSAMDFSE